MPAEAVPLVDLDCGDSIDKSVRLADDLLDCTADGLDVTAPNIVIDLNGHLIAHTLVRSADDAGVENTGSHPGVTVRNGSIRGFELGIDGRSATTPRSKGWS